VASDANVSRIPSGPPVRPKSNALKQRAWVAPNSQRLIKEPAPNEDLVISFNLSNTGKTPALDVELREEIAIGKFDGPDGDPPVPDWKTVETVKGANIFPNSTSGALKETLEGRKVTENVVNIYKAPQSMIRIYLRIRVDYYDVFGRHHWIETCSKHKNGDAPDFFEQCSGGGVDRTKALALPRQPKAVVGYLNSY
jgi:hypothetical protein